MVLLIIAVLVALVGVAMTIWTFSATNKNEAPPLAVGVALFFLALLLVTLSSLTKVSTKNVGVVTSFGRPTGENLANGLHFKKPWEKVTELDGTIITNEYKGDDCITVTIADGSKACVSGALRWRIVPSQASVLFQDYRSDDVNESIRDALVRTQWKASVNATFKEFNPLLQANQQGTEDVNQAINIAPDLDSYSDQVEQSMRQRLTQVGDGTAQVDIVDITLSYVSLSQTTQDKIDALQAEIANTRIAQQRSKTSSAQAAANKALSDSVSNDPNVLVSKCFDIVEDAVETGYQLPAGFSCWQGGGSAVVVPSTK